MNYQYREKGSKEGDRNLSDELSIEKRYQKIDQIVQTHLFPNKPIKEVDDLNLIIDSIYDKDIVRISEELHQYNQIKQLSLILNDIHFTQNLPFQLQLFGYLIGKVCKSTNVVIRKKGQAISTGDFLCFLKEIEKCDSVKALTIEMIQLIPKYDLQREYNLKMFGQQLGMFDQLSQLNINLKDYGITQDNIYYVLQAIPDCLYLETLSINLQSNNLQTEGLHILSQILPKCKQLTNLTLQLDIYHISPKERRILSQIITSMKNLFQVTLYINLIFQVSNEQEEKEDEEEQEQEQEKQEEEQAQMQEKKQKEEEEVQEDRMKGEQSQEMISIEINNNIKYFDLCIQSAKGQNKKVNESLGIDLISKCKQLNELKLNLCDSSQEYLIRYAEVLPQFFNLKYLHLNLSMESENQQSLLQFGQNLSQCQNLYHLSISASNCNDLESLTLLTDLIQNYNSVRVLTVNLQYNTVSSAMFNCLITKISTFKLLQTLSIKAGLNLIQFIDFQIFHSTIQKNKYLNMFIFDFQLKPKQNTINWKTNQLNNQSSYCGNYYVQMHLKEYSLKQMLKAFIEQMTKGRAFKKNIRLVHTEILQNELYQTYGENKGEHYQILNDYESL